METLKTMTGKQIEMIGVCNHCNCWDGLCVSENNVIDFVKPKDLTLIKYGKNELQFANILIKVAIDNARTDAWLQLSALDLVTVGDMLTWDLLKQG